MALRERLREAVRSAVGERERMLLSRLSLAAGLRPRVNRSAAHRLPFPDGRRAAVVISADFELAWAWRWARSADPVALARRRAAQGRQNLGVLLDLCDRYQLPITWATVGHLFLDRCAPTSGIIHPEVPRVPHFTNDLWTYQRGDWFDHDPGAADTSHPDWADWYGPDLVRAILSRPVRHEIGCHTFSHAVFSEDICPPAVAAAELTRCQELAADWGLRLTSFVFSGNVEGNHLALRRAGFSAYRSDDWYDLDVPRRDAFGLWRMSGGVCLDRPYGGSPAAYHVRLLRRCVDLAIRNGLVCGFWFHPETSPRDVDEIFTPLFDYIARRRADLWVTTMGGMVGWLETSAGRGEPASERQGSSREAVS